MAGIRYLSQEDSEERFTGKPRVCIQEEKSVLTEVYAVVRVCSEISQRTYPLFIPHREIQAADAAKSGGMHTVPQHFVGMRRC
jgi:hypothetical protein